MEAKKEDILRAIKRNAYKVSSSMNSSSASLWGDPEWKQAFVDLVSLAETLQVEKEPCQKLLHISCLNPRLPLPGLLEDMAQYL